LISPALEVTAGFLVKRSSCSVISEYLMGLSVFFSFHPPERVRRVPYYVSSLPSTSPIFCGLVLYKPPISFLPKSLPSPGAVRAVGFDDDICSLLLLVSPSPAFFFQLKTMSQVRPFTENLALIGFLLIAFHDRLSGPYTYYKVSSQL